MFCVHTRRAHGSTVHTEVPICTQKSDDRSTDDRSTDMMTEVQTCVDRSTGRQKYCRQKYCLHVDRSGTSVYMSEVLLYYMSTVFQTCRQKHQTCFRHVTEVQTCRQKYFRVHICSTVRVAQVYM